MKIHNSLHSLEHEDHVDLRLSLVGSDDRNENDFGEG